MTQSLRQATIADVSRVTALINRAFAVERFFLERDRVTEEEVRELLATGDFLLMEASGQVIGSVHCRVQDGLGKLGLLSVDPDRQGQGLGRALVAAAEQYFRSAGCDRVELRVVNLRTELPPFYRRLGFRHVGEEPFPLDIAVSQPVKLLRMSKSLAHS